MEQHQIRRLIVLNRDKRLVGILSLGDLAIHTADDGLTGEVAEAVSENLPSRKDRRKLAVPRDCRRRQTPERERLP